MSKVINMLDGVYIVQGSNCRELDCLSAFSEHQRCRRKPKILSIVALKPLLCAFIFSKASPDTLLHMRHIGFLDA